MKALSLLVTVTTLLLAQAPTIANATGPDSVVAVLNNGRKMTAAEWERRLAEIPEKAREHYRQDPADLLRRIAYYESTVDAARQAKLDQQTPYKEKIEGILYDAEITEVNNKLLVMPEEQKQYFEAHKNELKYVKAKALSMLLVNPGSKEKMTELAEKARAGKPLADLQKEDDKKLHYDPAVSINLNPAIPNATTAAVSKAKVGDVTEPLRVDANYVIYQIDSIVPADYDKVKDDIYQKLKAERLQQWYEQQIKSVKVEITNQDYFKTTRP